MHEGSPSWQRFSLSGHLGQASPPQQFNISAHYDTMAQLDADVHDDVELSRTEVEVALRLIGFTPQRLFLPCFGTGRHIQAFLNAGVERIVGVDLSPACVGKAQEQFGDDARVELHVGDLRSWRTNESFDAAVLLGNSFGDIVDRKLLAEVTEGMVAPLRRYGAFLMDYIGEGYLSRCREGVSSEWNASLNGRSVRDRRTARFDPLNRVMTISVEASDAETEDLLWSGAYQKTVFDDRQVVEHFGRACVRIKAEGRATVLNTAYYGGYTGDLGMIASSTWWIGRKA